MVLIKLGRFVPPQGWVTHLWGNVHMCVHVYSWVYVCLRAFVGI